MNRRTTGQYGLRGVRVGEASHPGHQNCCYVVQAFSALQRWLSPRWIHTRISSPQFLSSMMVTHKAWQPPVPDISGEEDSPVEEEVPALVFGAGARAALQEFDEVELKAEFIARACVMKCPQRDGIDKGIEAVLASPTTSVAQASPRRASCRDGSLILLLVDGPWNRAEGALNRQRWHPGAGVADGVDPAACQQSRSSGSDGGVVGR